ncbi:MAG: hypothetical protein ACRCWO_04000, partial [Bosea sp. (in: a-proteobacteria)]
MLLKLRDAVKGLPVLARPLLAIGRFVYVGGRGLMTSLGGLARLPGAAWRFRREWISSENRGIGRAAAGRTIAMLV